MLSKFGTTLGALALFTGAGHAGVVAYEYNGTVSTNTFWSFMHGLDVRVRLELDTGVAASSMTADRAQYDGAVIGGFFSAGEYTWAVDPDGAVNNVVLRTDVFDQNFGTFSNRLGISVSVEDGAQGPFQFPSNILFNVIDNDDPNDTVEGLGMTQPLETMRTISNGGVDQFSTGLGVTNNNVSSTIVSGDGGIRVIPAPAGVASLGIAGLAAMRRRRG